MLVEATLTQRGRLLTCSFIRCNNVVLINQFWLVTAFIRIVKVPQIT